MLVYNHSPLFSLYSQTVNIYDLLSSVPAGRIEICAEYISLRYGILLRPKGKS